MRVLHAIPSFYPVTGGAERNVYYLARECVRLGIQSTILTYNMDSRWKPKRRSIKFESCSIPVVRCGGFRPFPNWKYLRALMPSLTGMHVLPTENVSYYLKSCDIIHLHDEVDLSFALFGLLANVPRIFHIRTLPFIIQAFRKFRSRAWLLRHAAHFYICNSIATADCLRSLGVDSSRIVVIPNGVDTSVFWRSEDINRKWRRILFVGRAQKEKGLHILLDALSIIRSPLDVTLVFGSITDADYFKQQMCIVEQLKRRNGHKVQIYVDLDHKRLARLYNSGGILVCPSFSEPFGNVVIEAMACGLAVVGSNSGGILDIIDDGTDGILFKTGDSSELARIICRLLKSQQLIRRISAEAVKTVYRDYTWSIVAKKVAEVYDVARKQLSP